MNSSDGHFKENFKANVKSLLDWEDSISKKFSDFGIKTNLNKYGELLDQVLEKNAKTNIDVVVIGKTSSGKSLMINGFLGIDVMQSGIGHTTPSAVRIQTTAEPTSYYKYSNDEQRHEIDFSNEESLEEFHDILDSASGSDSHTDQCIEVYISESILKQTCIISEKVAILDTPGIERDVFKNDDVHKRILEADALVLVVDIVSWSDNEAIRNLLNDKNYFVTPNVIVAVNKCDTLLKEKKTRKRENIKNNLKKDLSELNVFNGRSNKEIDTSTSFVSAKVISDVETTNNRENISDEQRPLVEEFHNLEEKILSTAKKNSAEKKDERIDDAIERCIKELKKEMDRITTEVYEVKEKIHELSDHIKESSMKVNDTDDHEFTKTAYIDDIDALGTVREKICAFLEHCKSKGFDDIKKTLIRTSVNRKISTFTDDILREEIAKIVGNYERLSSGRINELLNPLDSNSSTNQSELSDFEKYLANIEENMKQSFIDRKEQLDKEFEEFVHDVERKQNERLDLIEKIEKDNKFHGKVVTGAKWGTIPAAMSIPATYVVGKTIAGLVAAKSVTSTTFFSIVAAALSVPPPVWIAAGVVGVVGVGIGVYSYCKQKSGNTRMDENGQEIMVNFENVDDKRVSVENEKDELTQKLESARNASQIAMEEHKERKRLEEENQRIKKERINLKKALNALFTSVIRNVSKAVQMRFNNTERFLDFLKNQDQTDEKCVREVWRWVSNNVKSMQTS